MVVSELLADQKGKQDDSLVAAGCMGTSLRNVAQQSTRSKDIQNSRSKDSQSKHTQKATKRLPISNYALLNI